MKFYVMSLFLFTGTVAMASPPDEEPESELVLPPVQIQGSSGDKKTIGGATNSVDERQLEEFEYNNTEAVLGKVPGVTIRTEDGYGLRPNIGIRGANSDRSKKVTLMEDGILFGPAPYSAPAAYYFPLLTRMTGIEVYKGPAAIQYGPQTIGGAIGFFTRRIEPGSTAGADLGYGSSLGDVDHYHKLHAHYGYGADQFGALVEGVHLMTNGFKELDGGGDTGFNKQEFMLKLRGNSDPDMDSLHTVELKLGFSREDSAETYLGLTDSDFAKNPYRRYAASQLGQMTLLRTQAELTYTGELDNGVDIRATAYHHWMTRDWRKLNRMGTSTSLADILANPTGVREVFYNVLTGSQDSTSPTENLWVGNNARAFHSAGLDTTAAYRFQTAALSHEVRLGLRYHYDQIERDHTENEYQMLSGRLSEIGSPQLQTANNLDSAHAIAATLQYGLRVAGVTIQPGLRLEWVQVARDDRETDTQTSSSDLAVLPGLGVHYDFWRGLGLLAGVHRGFSPVAPGQDTAVSPEYAINYEFGLRYQPKATTTLIEAVGFVSDYSNIVGQCSFSSGCADTDLDKQFNGGNALIGGLELVAQYTVSLPDEYRLPIRLSYTYTHATFQSAFASDNPQFGNVSEGDFLPYVPTHQGALSIGVSHPKWALNLGLTYIGEMREVASQGEAPMTDAAWLFDASASYSPLEWMDIYITGENLANARAIASRRPFGARPTRPLQLMGGIRLRYN